MSRAARVGIFLASLASAVALAGEAQIQLPDGPGKDRVVGNCITCHSLDYLKMNSFLDRDGWKAELDKMKNKMGAPISDSDAPLILEYLATHFGSPGLRLDQNSLAHIEK